MAILAIVVPVFSIILLGWAAAKTGYLGEDVGRLIAEFAFKIAMPALLFRATLSLGTLASGLIDLAIVYLSAVAIVWALATMLSLFVLRRPAEDSASISMGASFGNTVMLGLPLALTTFGAAAGAPIALLITLDTPLMWILATLQIETVRHRGSGTVGYALLRVLGDLLRNPIVMALVAGTAARMAGLTLVGLPDRILAILGEAAVPSALFALGTSLVRFEIRGQRATLITMLVLKLLVFPAVAFALATVVFDLPPLLVAVVTMFAAMPVGANAYLFAARYERATGSVSAAVAISTTISAATVSAVLYLLGAGSP